MAAFSAGHAAIVSRRAPCSFKRQARLPLRVGHLEEVDLRHRARDVEQRVDAPERGQGLIDHGLGGGRLGEVDIDDQRFRAGGLHRLRRVIQIGAVPGDEDQRREVAREASSRRPADPLARARDDGD